MMRTIILAWAFYLILSTGCLAAEKSPSGGERSIAALGELLSRDDITPAQRKDAMKCLSRYGESGLKILLKTFDEHLKRKDNTRLLEDLDVLGKISDRKVALRILRILDADVQREIKLLAISQLRSIVRAGVSFEESVAPVRKGVITARRKVTIYGKRVAGRPSILARGSTLTPNDLNILKRGLTKFVQREDSDEELVAEARKTLEAIKEMKAELKRAKKNIKGKK